jgi:hypothetical protein
MNYIDRVAARIGRAIGSECEQSLLRIYAVLALALGDDVRRRDVHDAWSAWCAGRDPQHRSLVPYSELSPEVQALDQPYAEAICQVVEEIRAERWWPW